VYQTNAIVLARRPLGEHDELVSFYTQDFGKLVIRVRGIKKTTTKQGNFLHTFGVTGISFILGKGGPLLSGVVSVRAYPGVTNHLLAHGYTGSFLALCDKLLYEYAKDDALWKLLVTVLEEAEQISQEEGEAKETLWAKEKMWLVSLMETLGVLPRMLHTEKAANKSQFDHYLQRVLEDKFNTPLSFFGLRMSFSSRQRTPKV